MEDLTRYLKSKKIDPARLQAEENAVWAEFEREFPEMHQESFTAQKLYLINDLRRKYPFVEASVSNEGEDQSDSQTKPLVSNTKSSRPVIKAKPIIKK